MERRRGLAVHVLAQVSIGQAIADNLVHVAVARDVSPDDRTEGRGRVLLHRRDDVRLDLSYYLSETVIVAP